MYGARQVVDMALTVVAVDDASVLASQASVVLNGDDEDDDWDRTPSNENMLRAATRILSEATPEA